MSCPANQWAQPILKDLPLHSILILISSAFSALLMGTQKMSGASGKWVGFKPGLFEQRNCSTLDEIDRRVPRKPRPSGRGQGAQYK
jgi:hypothetical protein